MVGTAPFTYQWYFNGSPINGATNNPLRLTNVSSTDAGSYSVVAINALGMANSSAATLNVVPRVSVGLFSDPEFITTQNVQNLAATLGQFGHAVRPFSNLPAGITNDVVIFPQIGNAPLSPQLDSGSRALLQAYVLRWMVPALP